MQHPLPPDINEAEFRRQVIALLTKLNRSSDEAVSGRESFSETVMVSATTPIQLDYRNRRHIYIQSGVALTLSLEDIGQATVPANVWTDISYTPGMYLYAVGQAANVAVRIKQTDETIAPGSNGSATTVTGTVTANQGTPANWAVNLAQVLGAAITGKNSVPTMSQILYWLLNGGASIYSITTGKQTSGAANSQGLSVFMPAAANKNLLVISALATDAAAGAGNAHLNYQTVDPALTGVTPTYVQQATGATSGAASSITANSGANAAAPTGTNFRTTGVSGNLPFELYEAEIPTFIPAGTGAGITLYYDNAAANGYSLSMIIVEFN